MRRLQEEQLRAYESELRRDCGREEYVSRLERECEELRALVEQAHSAPANGAKNGAMNDTTGGAPAVSVAPAADPPVADPSAAKPSAQPMPAHRSLSRQGVAKWRNGSASSTALTGPSMKSQIQLIKATGENVELQAPKHNCVETVLKDETLVKLMWVQRPHCFLLVKKPGQPTVTAAMREVALTITKLVAEGGDEAPVKLIVEPAVYAEAELKLPNLLTWSCKDLKSPPKASLIAFDDLPRLVDVCVCLGGDGTLLWASSLFPTFMPPVISFAMGSLGFLTPFTTETHEAHLRHLIHEGCNLTPRVRLSCRVQRANETTPGVEYLALNEAVIERGNHSFLGKLDVLVDELPVTTAQAHTSHLPSLPFWVLHLVLFPPFNQIQGE